MPNANETATIEINGKQYSDWETISVECQYPGTYRTAIFTVSEKDPAPGSRLAATQIKPQDECTVKLGGHLILTGYVVQRQAFYDGGNHGVLIEAHNRPADAVRTSIAENKQWQNKTIIDIAKEIYKARNIEVIIRGNTANMLLPFPDVQVMPGEPEFHLIERLARERMTWMGDNEFGQMILDGGSDAKAGPSLVEGQNIKWARTTIKDTELMSHLYAYGQAVGNDDNWARDVTEIKYLARDERMKRYKPASFLTERALAPETAKREIKLRGDFEFAWRAASWILCEVGVQGWTRYDGGGLWLPGNIELIHVDSPMAMVTQDMVIQKATFRQSNAEGTMTLLELVLPAFFKDGNFQLNQGQSLK